MWKTLPCHDSISSFVDAVTIQFSSPQQGIEKKKAIFHEQTVTHRKLVFFCFAYFEKNCWMRNIILELRGMMIIHGKIVVQSLSVFD